MKAIPPHTHQHHCHYRRSSSLLASFHPILLSLAWGLLRGGVRLEKMRMLPDHLHPPPHPLAFPHSCCCLNMRLRCSLPLLFSKPHCLSFICSSINLSSHTRTKKHFGVRQGISAVVNSSPPSHCYYLCMTQLVCVCLCKKERKNRLFRLLLELSATSKHSGAVAHQRYELQPQKLPHQQRSPVRNQYSKNQ